MINRIAIIGATGAIGTALLDYCIQNQTEAYVLIRPDSNRVGRIPKNPLLHLIDCDMKHMKNLDARDIPRIDVFYQFAWIGTHGIDARNDMDSQVANIQYTIDAVHLAARLGCTAFIGAGTQAEYGRVEGILSPGTECRPENGYGIAKLCAGQMSRIECKKLGIRHVWGRIVSTYGPRDGVNSMVSCAIRESLVGRNPEFTKGEQIWDYLYSGDAGEAFYRMGESGKDGAIYVLGSGKTKTLKEYIEIICREANPKVTPVFGTVPYMDKQVMHLQADISALTADTGFRPKVNFEDGIARTVEWFKAHYNEMKR